MSNIYFNISSRNSKTGPMLVTTQSQDTCPRSCPFNGSGCYAQMGPILIHWKKVNNGERAHEWNQFLQAVRKLQPGALWRMSQAGDLPGLDDEIDSEKLNQVIQANRKRKGFTFTHKALTAENQQLIKHANDNGFTINLSADSLSDADAKAELNIGPVVVPIHNDPAKWPTHTPNGRRIVVCLHSTKNLKCTECRLCAHANRKSIVGFPAHGVKKRQVEQVIEKN